MPEIKGILATIACGAMLFSAAACEDASRVTTGHSTSDSARLRMAPSQPNRTESPAVMDRIAHDRARLAWVGEIHTDAMREFSALQAAGGGFDRPIADKCADLEKVVTRTAERAYQIADVHLTQLEIRESVVAAIAHTGKCNGMRPMSVLTIPPI
jgi:hypothetical protein